MGKTPLPNMQFDERYSSENETPQNVNYQEENNNTLVSYPEMDGLTSPNGLQFNEQGELVVIHTRSIEVDNRISYAPSSRAELAELVQDGIITEEQERIFIQKYETWHGPLPEQANAPMSSPIDPPMSSPVDTSPLVSGLTQEEEESSSVQVDPSNMLEEETSAPPQNEQEQQNERTLEEQIAANESLSGTNLLQAIEQLEGLAAQDGYDNKKTLSAFRKLFYNSGNWDTVIAGAKNTGMPPSWDATDHVALKNAVSNSQIVTINGQSLDFGHLLTGLDATNYSTPITFEKFGLDIFEFRSNKEFATYVGDLGSAVEAYVDEGHTSNWAALSTKDQAMLERHYNNLAGEVDMAGNVDSYAMDFDPALSLSANMRRYYEGNPSQDQQRYTTFAQKVGLGNLENGAFSNDTAAYRKELIKEVDTFAQAFQMREGAWEGITTWGGTVYYDNAATWMVEHFIQQITLKVQQENP